MCKVNMCVWGIVSKWEKILNQSHMENEMFKNHFMIVEVKFCLSCTKDRLTVLTDQKERSCACLSLYLVRVFDNGGTIGEVWETHEGIHTIAVILLVPLPLCICGADQLERKDGIE